MPSSSIQPATATGRNGALSPAKSTDSLSSLACLLGLHHTTDHVERSHLFLTFAGALRNGQYGNGRQASGTHITATLRWCALFMVARDLVDPRRASSRQHNLDRCISSYLKKCSEDDPPSLPQQACPNTTIRLIAITFFATQSRRLHVVADLLVLAFFFLLRVGEYTPSSQPRRKTSFD
jgi:hypothetical protein